MRRLLALTFVATFAMSFAACSSSEKRESDGSEGGAVTEAGTDAVPMDQAEASNPAGSTEVQAAADTSPQDPSAGDDSRARAQAQASPPVPGSGEFADYTVNSGDTLMKIAFEVYGDLYQWRRILEANRDKVQDPNGLTKGLVLKVEKPASSVQIDRNGQQYLIKRGDTLGTISGQVYGTPARWKALWENNRQLIKDPNRIFAGFTLYYVPDAGGAPPVVGGGASPAPASAAAQANAGERAPASQGDTGGVKAPSAK